MASTLERGVSIHRHGGGVYTLTMRRTAVILCIAALGASCVTRGRLHSLPSTSGRTAMLEAAQLLFDLMNQCHGDDVSPWSQPWAASVKVRGVAGRYRVDRNLRVGFWPNGSAMRIESVPLTGDGSFVLMALSAPNATLLLENGTRVIQTDRVSPLLATLIGAPLSPIELEALLRGCYFQQPDLHRGGVGESAIPTLYGGDWVSIPFGRNGRALYRRTSAGAPWRPTTLLYPGEGLEPAWRVDYRDIHEQRPHTMLVTGIERKNVSLEITLSSVLSASLPDDLFQIAVPAASRPIAIDDIDVARLLAP